MKEILSTYEQALGQAINLQKLEIFFSRNMDNDAHNTLKNVLGLTKSTMTRKYLGVPSMVGCSKKVVFHYIKDKMWRKLNS